MYRLLYGNFLVDLFHSRYSFCVFVWPLWGASPLFLINIFVFTFTHDEFWIFFFLFGCWFWSPFQIFFVVFLVRIRLWTQCFWCRLRSWLPLLHIILFLLITAFGRFCLRSRFGWCLLFQRLFGISSLFGLRRWSASSRWRWFSFGSWTLGPRPSHNFRFLLCLGLLCWFASWVVSFGVYFALFISFILWFLGCWHWPFLHFFIFRALCLLCCSFLFAIRGWSSIPGFPYWFLLYGCLLDILFFTFTWIWFWSGRLFLRLSLLFVLRNILHKGAISPIL